MCGGPPQKSAFAEVGGSQSQVQVQHRAETVCKADECSPLSCISGLDEAFQRLPPKSRRPGKAERAQCRKIVGMLQAAFNKDSKEFQRASDCLTSQSSYLGKLLDKSYGKSEDAVKNDEVATRSQIQTCPETWCESFDCVSQGPHEVDPHVCQSYFHTLPLEATLDNNVVNSIGPGAMDEAGDTSSTGPPAPNKSPMFITPPPGLSFSIPPSQDLPMPWQLLAKPAAAIQPRPLSLVAVQESMSTNKMGQEKHADRSAITQKQNMPKGKGQTCKADRRALLICKDDILTVMIKNIPGCCTREEVVDAMTEMGFGDAYRHLYVPMGKDKRQNMGYAFAGFPDVDTAARFTAAMTGYRFPGWRQNSKCCVIEPAHTEDIHTANKSEKRLRRSEKMHISI